MEDIYRVIILDGVTYTVLSSPENIKEKIKNPYAKYAYEMNGLVLPIRNINETKPGFYITDLYIEARYLVGLDFNKYSSDNIINFNDNMSINEYMNKNQDMINQRNHIIMTSSNINGNQVSKFSNNYDDTPIKEVFINAINAKGVNIHAYKDIIGKTFTNDLRSLKTRKDISLKSALRWANALDMEIEMIIRDKDNAINPMNEEFRKILN